MSPNPRRHVRDDSTVHVPRRRVAASRVPIGELDAPPGKVPRGGRETKERYRRKRGAGSMNQEECRANSAAGPRR